MSYKKYETLRKLQTVTEELRTSYKKLQKVTGELRKVAKSYEKLQTVTNELRKVTKSYKRVIGANFKSLIFRNLGKIAFL